MRLPEIHVRGEARGIGFTPTHFAFLRSGLDADADSGSGGEGDEHLEAELLLFASHQIRHAGLADTEKLGRLCLGQLFGLEDLPHLRHEIRTHLKDRGFLGREPQIREHIAGRIDAVLAHVVPPICLYLRRANSMSCRLVLRLYLASSKFLPLPFFHRVSTIGP